MSSPEISVILIFFIFLLVPQASSQMRSQKFLIYFFSNITNSPLIEAICPYLYTIVIDWIIS
jgi:hypothetical protein